MQITLSIWVGSRVLAKHTQGERLAEVTAVAQCKKRTAAPYKVRYVDDGSVRWMALEDLARPAAVRTRTRTQSEARKQQIAGHLYNREELRQRSHEKHESPVQTTAEHASKCEHFHISDEGGCPLSEHFDISGDDNFEEVNVSIPQIAYIGSPGNLKNDVVSEPLRELIARLRHRGHRVYVGPPNSDLEHDYVQDMNDASLDMFSVVLVAPGGPGAQKEASRFSGHTAIVCFKNSSDTKFGHPEWMHGLASANTFDLNGMVEFDVVVEAIEVAHATCGEMEAAPTLDSSPCRDIRPVGTLDSPLIFSLEDDWGLGEQAVVANAAVDVEEHGPVSADTSYVNGMVEFDVVQTIDISNVNSCEIRPTAPLASSPCRETRPMRTLDTPLTFSMEDDWGLGEQAIVAHTAVDVEASVLDLDSLSSQQGGLAQHVCSSSPKTQEQGKAHCISGSLYDRDGMRARSLQRHTALSAHPCETRILTVDAAVAMPATAQLVPKLELADKQLGQLHVDTMLEAEIKDAFSALAQLQPKNPDRFLVGFFLGRSGLCDSSDAVAVEDAIELALKAIAREQPEEPVRFMAGFFLGQSQFTSEALASATIADAVTQDSAAQAGGSLWAESPSNTAAVAIYSPVAEISSLAGACVDSGLAPPSAAIQETIEADGTFLCASASDEEVDAVDPLAGHATPSIGASAGSDLLAVSAVVDEAVNVTGQLQSEPLKQGVDRLVCVDQCCPLELLPRHSVLGKLNRFTDDADAVDTVPALALFAVFVMASAEMNALQGACRRRAIEAAVEVVEPCRPRAVEAAAEVVEPCRPRAVEAVVEVVELARCKRQEELMAMKPFELKKILRSLGGRARSCDSKSPHPSVVAAASSRDRLVQLILEAEFGGSAPARAFRNAGA